MMSPSRRNASENVPFRFNVSCQAASTGSLSGVPRDACTDDFPLPPEDAPPPPPHPASGTRSSAAKAAPKSFFLKSIGNPPYYYSTFSNTNFGDSAS